MTHHESLGAYFCKTCEEFFEIGQGAQDVPMCPTCNTEATTHCPACKEAVKKTDNKACHACGEAY